MPKLKKLIKKALGFSTEVAKCYSMVHKKIIIKNLAHSTVTNC
jgi:hypothetical protein